MPKPDPAAPRPNDRPNDLPRDQPNELVNDPLLRDAPTVEGFKVLDPAVLYAKVGQGGMGAVYRGRHFKLDLDVAVKCLKPSLAAEDPDFVKRFEREARLAASIGHQNVVRVMDVQEKNGLHYLVMEFVRGETARERVKRKGKLTEAEALAILLGATAGLAEAHARGIVHRDIKPDNIMVSLEGRVKLADLGLAKSSGNVDGRSLSMSMSAPASRIMGTPQYMPPEQWKSTDVDAAADIWALGATFFYLVTGRASWPGQRKGQPDLDYLNEISQHIQNEDHPDLRTERPDLKPAVHALFERCVRRDPNERFTDARALLKELRKLQIDEEEVLFDPETGSGILRAGVVTPPPRQTLLRIRAAVETMTGQATTAEPAGGFAPRSEGQTIPSARAAARSPMVLVLGVLLLGLLGIGYAAGWFTSEDLTRKTDDEARRNEGKPQPTATPEKEKPSSPAPTGDTKADARAAYERGKQLLPQKGQLDAAIAAFEDALRLDGSLLDVKDPLAAALSQRVKELGDSDLDRAFMLCTRAAALKPGDRVVLLRHEELRGKLAARLVAGLAITTPMDGALLSSRQLLLEGSAESKNLRAVRFALLPGNTVRTTFPEQSQDASVISGAWSGPCQFAADGAWQIWIEGEDGNGVKAMLSAACKVVVDTVDPVLVLQQPLANVPCGARVAVGGKVTDASVCTVMVNGQAAKVDGDRFALDLTMGDGRQEIVVVVRDAVGRTVMEKRSIVVDAVAPGLTLAVLPKVTKDNQVSIAGTVKDLQGGELKVDGKVVTAAADGAFAVPFALGSDQSFAIEVEAKDALGNRSTAKVVVRRDTVAPVVEWTSPDASKPVQAGEVEVAGTVQDEGGVAGVTVNGQVATLRGSVWTAKVAVATAASGSTLLATTRVTVVATDAVGIASKPLLRVLTAAPTFGAKIETSIGLTMIRIDPKPFTMGTPGNTGDETPHQVTITKGYWIGETEVTQAQWKAVMGAKNWGSDYEKVGDRYPATTVDWNEAVAFCDKLTEMERAAGRLPDGCRYGLPSEAEWEYACRGGSTSAFCYGDEENRLAEFAVFGKEVEKGNSADPVRTKKPNAFGLYDMHGNVWEWCADYADYTDGKVVTNTYAGAVTDPLCLSGSLRVFRGGCWLCEPASCRSAYRFAFVPGYAYVNLGFRPALLARSSSK